MEKGNTNTELNISSEHASSSYSAVVDETEARYKKLKISQGEQNAEPKPSFDTLEDYALHYLRSRGKEISKDGKSFLFKKRPNAPKNGCVSSCKDIQIVTNEATLKTEKEHCPSRNEPCSERDNSPSPNINLTKQAAYNFKFWLDDESSMGKESNVKTSDSCEIIINALPRSESSESDLITNDTKLMKASTSDSDDDDILNWTIDISELSSRNKKGVRTDSRNSETCELDLSHIIENNYNSKPLSPTGCVLCRQFKQRPRLIYMKEPPIVECGIPRFKFDTPSPDDVARRKFYGGCNMARL